MSAFADMHKKRIRVGYAISQKKRTSFIRPPLTDYARECGVDLVQIIEDRPIREHGLLDCIVHKRYGDGWAQELRTYTSKHPKTVVIDQPEDISRLHNRISMLQVVSELESPPDKETYGTPKQVVVYDNVSLFHPSTLASLKFPVVAKPLIADGSERSHQMSLLYNSTALSTLTPPVVLQEFVNHGGIIFKVYVLGKNVKCVKRESLPDVTKEKLESTDVAESFMTFSQISNLRVSGDSEVRKYYERMNLIETEMPAKEFLEQLAEALRRATKLHLFNFDMIRDANTHRYLIIDINYFPGYAKMPSYETVFVEFLKEMVRK